MRLVPNDSTRAAALSTLRELVANGYAGNDCYDHDIFVVDAPTQGLRDDAEIAVDMVGGELHRVGAYRASRDVVQARLPRWVRAELGLDGPGAPEIVTPLASRALPSSRLECEVELRQLMSPQAVDLVMATVFADAPGHVGEFAAEARKRTGRR